MNTTDYENELKQRDETIERQADRIKQLEAKIDELEKLLAGKAEAKAAKKPKFSENYSLGKNARKKKRRKKSTGRRSVRSALATAKPSIRMSHPIMKRRSFDCKTNWSITLHACSCLSSIPRSSQPTIVANGTSVAKRKSARAVVPAKRRPAPDAAA
jgi:predicted RNase H-like nuclease (RuvC/YqgF family)